MHICLIFNLSAQFLCIETNVPQIDDFMMYVQWYAFLALPPGTKSRSSNLDYVKEQFEGWTGEIHACLDNTPGIYLYILIENVVVR
jgi:hypothetical protein